MAVQQNKKSRARRGMRRAHDGLSGPTLTTDALTGEVHRRHHISPDGFYRGRQVVIPRQEDTAEDDD
jgi:large subunit ribosomal protein L32